MCQRNVCERCHFPWTSENSNFTTHIIYQLTYALSLHVNSIGYWPLVSMQLCLMLQVHVRLAVVLLEARCHLFFKCSLVTVFLHGLAVSTPWLATRSSLLNALSSQFRFFCFLAVIIYDCVKTGRQMDWVALCAVELLVISPTYFQMDEDNDDDANEAHGQNRFFHRACN